ncbi:hypothetical protein BKA65DRAFT_547139 [Rhexocercosporidium sp. MPI-PUGE-AT-0058]|nr:hypothetical protein BKA65DRAFT_547139 [Rhexocercosporidium sp. MPI-PUGE-AT-0058]
MFINAEPRFVSNGFETFVPFHRAEALHQRLVEMTNNDVNAWSIFRPLVPSTGESWDGNLDEYSNNENFQVHSLYGGYYQDSPPISQNKVAGLPRSVAHSQARQPQCRSFENVSISQPLYQEPVPEMNCLEQPSPMLGHDYSQMSLGRGRGSFAEFSSVRNVLKNLSYQPQVDARNSSFTSSSGLSQSTYAEEASIFNNSMNISSTSPNTMYSSYSPPQASASHRTMDSTDTRNSYMTSTKTHYWQSNLRSSKGTQNTYELPLGQDGLPRYPNQQYDSWSSAYGTASTWDPQSLASNTISPKMLTLNVSSASLSSSGSSQGSVLALSESSGAMSVDDPGEPPLPERLQVVEPQPIPRPRQILPDCPPSSHRIVPVVPSNSSPPSRNTNKRLMKVVKSPSQTRRKNSPPARGIPATFHSPSPRSSDAGSLISGATPPRIELNLVELASAPQSFAAAQAIRDREAQDDFLVQSKLAGMSYKDIRRVGKFTEAESTLRGRFRNLTKDKTQRVRKPEWEDNDIRLLKKAVRKLTRPSDLSRARIPWKQVAEYIASHGGSYHFGNATCRKRWDDLEGRQR